MSLIKSLFFISRVSRSTDARGRANATHAKLMHARQYKVVRLLDAETPEKGEHACSENEASGRK